MPHSGSQMPMASVRVEIPECHDHNRLISRGTVFTRPRPIAVIRNAGAPPRFDPTKRRSKPSGGHWNQPPRTQPDPSRSSRSTRWKCANSFPHERVQPHAGTKVLGGGDKQAVGRDEEIDLLLRRWARAKAGDGQVVLISGEPGIGKSRITAALEERLYAEPHQRLRYFCSPYHQDSALYPFYRPARPGIGVRSRRPARSETGETRSLAGPRRAA
jgi:hypothetical protein